MHAAPSPLDMTFHTSCDQEGGAVKAIVKRSCRQPFPAVFAGHWHWGMECAIRCYGGGVDIAYPYKVPHCASRLEESHAAPQHHLWVPGHSFVAVCSSSSMSDKEQREYGKQIARESKEHNEGSLMQSQSRAWADVVQTDASLKVNNVRLNNRGVELSNVTVPTSHISRKVSAGFLGTPAIQGRAGKKTHPRRRKGDGGSSW